MKNEVGCRIAPPKMSARARRTRGFSLVELLTVMFIISALIAILVPSLNAARNSAKKTSTLASLNALKGGLDMFRNDNERQFGRTNGYPPSFAHPRMRDPNGNPIFDPILGEYPFVKEKPEVSGAHWLPAMLMGHDQGGYIRRKTVTKKDNLRYEPWRWYTPDPLGDGTPIDRSEFYADPGGLKTVLTENLPGRPNLTLFSEWEVVKKLRVIVDAFGQPILYYVANTNGRPSNMLEDERDKENEYAGGAPQQDGPPFYFHQDNHQFTGHNKVVGWDFDGPHDIAIAGENYTATDLTDPTNTQAQASFARFIIDRTIYRSLLRQAIGDGGGDAKGQVSDKTLLRPVNADSYLLISAGVDGRYGTNDDITNFPLAVE